jgi:hypothetical protein
MKQTHCGLKHTVFQRHTAESSKLNAITKKLKFQVKIELMDCVYSAFSWQYTFVHFVQWEVNNGLERVVLY